MTDKDSFMYSSAALQEDGSELADTSNEGLAISLIDILTQLAVHKRLVAAFTGGMMVAGLILAFLILPAKYTATTRIMTPQQVPSSAGIMMSQLSGAGAGSLMSLASGGSLLRNPNDLYVGMLKTRPIADAIIHRFDLDQVYRSKDMEAARKKLADNTVVTAERDGLIAVSFVDTDKKRSADVANAYTEELRNLMKHLALTEASQRRIFYEEQLKDAKESLLAAELTFQQVQQKKGLVQLDSQAKAMIESIAALRAQIAAKDVQVQSLRSYTTEHNPDLELAERQLSSLRDEAAKLEQQGHSAGFGEFGLAEVPGVGMEYLRADHDVRYQQALFDLLMKQYDAAKLDEAKETVVIQVVEPAIEPVKKSSPHRAQILAIFTVMGFVAGCLSVLFLNIRESVRSNQQTHEKILAFKRAIVDV
jgi:uncharacterized protein involved in exopolysaccharide biosynthesis